MDSYPTLEQCKEAKRYCWRMYSHKPWFFGCVYKQDEDHHVVGVEVRTDPNYTDRFTCITEHDGVKISWVKHDLEKHGEPYRTKQGTIED